MSEQHEVREGLHYSKEHEWVRVEGKLAIVGISDYAQRKLHEIIYIELPNVNQKVKQMEPIGSVESIKATSDIFSPLSGRIVEVNSMLMDAPERLNELPYDDGWIIKLEPGDPDELGGLMDADEYRRFLDELEEEEKA